MADEIQLKLVGSFILDSLCRHKLRNSYSDDFIGKRGSVSDADVLEGLAKIFDPSFQRARKTRTMVSNCSEYRHGSLTVSGWLDFDSDSYIKKATDLIKGDYEVALNRITELCHRLLEEKYDAFARIGRSLLTIITSDPTIPDTDDFYILENGRPIKKADIKPGGAYCFDSVLLGSWFYCISHKIRNEEERELVKEMLDCSVLVSKMGGFEKTVVEKRDWDSEAILVQKRLDDENALRRLRTKFNGYLNNVKTKYSSLRTLLFPDSSLPFYSIYTPNHIYTYTGHYIGSFPEGTFGDIPEDKRFRSSFTSGLSIRKPSAETILCAVGTKAILIGAPGSGKSMMARHLLLDSINRFNDDLLLPVYVELREYRDYSKNFEDFIFEHIKRYDDSVRPVITDDDIKDAAGHGKVFFILDGLDEIKTDLQDKFLSDLEHFSDSYGLCQMIVSSRPDVLRRTYAFSHYSNAYIAPFEKEQALEMVKKINYPENKVEIKNDFLKLLDQTLFDTHREFAENPLLLSIMLLTFERYGRVSSKMHVFYREAYDSLLEKHDVAKGLSRSLHSGVSKSVFTKVLETFCKITYIEQQYSFDHVSFERSFNHTKRFMNLSVPIEAKDFLRDLTDNIGIVLEEGPRIDFIHRSFQEYFCASYLSKADDEEIANAALQIDQNMNRGDQALSLFCDMCPDLIEKDIFLPFLLCWFDGKTPEEQIKTFILECYPFIESYAGDALKLDCEPTAPSSVIYQMIKRHLGLPDCVISLPVDEDFVTESFAYILKDDELVLESLGVNNFPLVDENGNVIDIATGWRSEIDTYELMNGEDCELKKAICSGAFYEELQTVLIYMELLKKRYA
ncbi:MAG: NACHT domain-containing protein [Bacilli bacterium]|nr:NACHT domain-containing protein [Bacilli bacterium]